MAIETPLLGAIIPELSLLGMITGIILLDLFFGQANKRLAYWFSQAALAVTFFLVVLQYQQFPLAVVAFHKSYAIDELAITVKLFVCLTSFFAFIYARDYIEDRGIALGEYY